MKKQFLILSFFMGHVVLFAESYGAYKGAELASSLDGSEELVRCVKCEKRDREKRQKLAYVILASVAQFFQGMLTLVHGGKQLDDKVKVEQGVLMMQAVGNIICQAQELDRYIHIGSEEITLKNTGASSDRRNALHQNDYDVFQSELVNLILLNPEWVREVLNNETSNTECLRVASCQQQQEVSSLADSSSESSRSCSCCSLMSRN